VDYLFKQIQDYTNFYDAGGIIIGHSHQINVGYSKIFATKHFMSSCRRWNERPTIEKNLGTIQDTLLRYTLTSQANAG
jgi:hypothetical protein